MDVVQRIQQILDKIQQYESTVDKSIIKVNTRFSLTAKEIIKKKIPLNVLGCTGVAKLFVYYANEVGLDCDVVFTANKNDLKKRLKDKISRINGHQLISVIDDGKKLIFDPRKLKLERINLDNFVHAGTVHIFTGIVTGKDIEKIDSVEKIEEIYLKGYKNKFIKNGVKKLQNLDTSNEILNKLRE